DRALRAQDGASARPQYSCPCRAGAIGAARVSPRADARPIISPPRTPLVDRPTARSRSGAFVEAGQDEFAMTERFGGGETAVRGPEHHLDQLVARGVH